MNCSAPMPGPRGDRNWWDDGPHHPHEPHSGSDPILVVVYVFVAVCAAIAGGIVVWGCS